MNVEEVREYCLSKKGAWDEFPFGGNILLFKVSEKAFIFADFNKPNQFTAKADPETAVELREKFDEIEPGFQMNKKHWITIHLEGVLTTKLIWEIIDQS